MATLLPLSRCSVVVILNILFFEGVITKVILVVNVHFDVVLYEVVIFCSLIEPFWNFVTALLLIESLSLVNWHFIFLVVLVFIIEVIIVDVIVVHDLRHLFLLTSIHRDGFVVLVIDIILKLVVDVVVELVIVLIFVVIARQFKSDVFGFLAVIFVLTVHFSTLIDDIVTRNAPIVLNLVLQDILIHNIIIFDDLGALNGHIFSFLTRL